jgi:1,4-alpha-glucan branching enzyme
MGKATDVMTVFTYTVPGMPLIYSGQEAGSTKRLKFFEKDPIDWSNQQFFALYQKLDQLKKANQALWNPGFGGNYTRLATGKDQQVLAFKREIGTNSVITVLNMSAEAVTIQLPADSAKGKYTEYFTGKKINPAAAPLSMDPWSYFIYTK